MSKIRRCQVCEYLDEDPYIFEWDEGCPICGAESDLTIEEEHEDEEPEDN